MSFRGESFTRAQISLSVFRSHHPTQERTRVSARYVPPRPEDGRQFKTTAVLLLVRRQGVSSSRRIAERNELADLTQTGCYCAHFASRGGCPRPNRTDVQHSDIKQYYEQNYEREKLETFPDDPPRTRALVEPIVSRLSRGARVLDVGCGVGHTCGYLDRKGFQVAGIDISAGALDHARQRLPQGEFELAKEDGSLPWEDASFDAVICLGVLEHIPEPDPVLDACHRVLRPGGHAVFVVPNSRSPYALLTSGTGQIYEEPRTLRGWRTLFDQHQLETMSVGRDPGPTLSSENTIKHNAKLLANKAISSISTRLTYQFIFHLKKA